jgi:pyruvate/2-oxoglutarate dehydrogenase complex dihydrolipoamide dehydrogenase (E3) component
VTEVDVLVIGVDTCGEDLSLQLLDAGLEVPGIEASLVGGECPYRACLPSKRMIRNGNLLAEARRADGRAGHGTVPPDGSLVARRVGEDVTGGWDDSSAVERFGARGGMPVKGHGRPAGPTQVTVGGRVVTARRGGVIATGSRPAVPPIVGLADVDAWCRISAFPTFHRGVGEAVGAFGTGVATVLDPGFDGLAESSGAREPS